MFFQRNELLYLEVQNSYSTINQLVHNVVLIRIFHNGMYKKFQSTKAIMVSRQYFWSGAPPQPIQHNIYPQNNNYSQMFSQSSPPAFSQTYPEIRTCTCPFSHATYHPPYQLKFHQNTGTTCEDLHRGPTQFPGAGRHNLSIFKQFCNLLNSFQSINVVSLKLALTCLKYLFYLFIWIINQLIIQLFGI